MDHFTFFIDVEEQHFDYIEQKVKDYNIEEYLIAHEKHNRKGEEKPHFHFIVYTNKKNLTNLVKHFVEKYKLRNTSGKRGGVRHYGTNGNKPIHDIEKYRTYCCKDKNVRSNLTEEQIQKYIDKSFQKEEKNQILYKSYLAIEENLEKKPYLYGDLNNYNTLIQHKEVIQNIRLILIKFCLKNNHKITKANINAMTMHYFKEKHKSEHDYSSIIYNFIFH